MDIKRIEKYYKKQRDWEWFENLCQEYVDNGSEMSDIFESQIKKIELERKIVLTNSFK